MATPTGWGEVGTIARQQRTKIRETKLGKKAAERKRFLRLYFLARLEPRASIGKAQGGIESEWGFATFYCETRRRTTLWPGTRTL